MQERAGIQRLQTVNERPIARKPEPENPNKPENIPLRSSHIDDQPESSLSHSVGKSSVVPNNARIELPNDFLNLNAIPLAASRPQIPPQITPRPPSPPPRIIQPPIRYLRPVIIPHHGPILPRAAVPPLRPQMVYEARAVKKCCKCFEDVTEVPSYPHMTLGCEHEAHAFCVRSDTNRENVCFVCGKKITDAEMLCARNAFSNS
eukprot:TRINITY_DN13383_c0_g2_i2.p2 TRINITY_DN13383_c0_g2~~TRINITY_DN13383_c0_g2_i2.p2  ORF type:complete len:204 (+),score=14.51 TRINITY_DN13383_c0_g2_i2:414-1025(+)